LIFLFRVNKPVRISSYRLFIFDTIYLTMRELLKKISRQKITANPYLFSVGAKRLDFNKLAKETNPS